MSEEPYVEYNFDPRKLPREYLEAIGMAVAAASQTNRILSDAIAGLAGVDVEYGAAMTTHMTVPLKIGAAKSLAAIRVPNDLDALDKLDAILANVKAALETRNSSAHDLWCSHPETGEVYKVSESARKHYKLSLDPAPIDEVKLEVLAIYEAGMSLQRFLMERGLCPALPEVRQRGHNTPEIRERRRKAVGK